VKHLRRIYESFGNGEETFEIDFDGIDVDVSGMPQEWEDRDLNIGENGKMRWGLSMNLNSRGIEWFATSVSQIVFFGMFDDDEEIELERQNGIETELYNITQSFYVHTIEVNMNDSKDPEDWDVKVYFGNPN